MKTTLNIPDDLIRDLKKKAADTRQTLTEVVAGVLRMGLADRKPGGKRKKLPTFRTGKIYVNVADREQLYRIMEGK